MISAYLVRPWVVGLNQQRAWPAQRRVSKKLRVEPRSALSWDAGLLAYDIVRWLVPGRVEEPEIEVLARERRWIIRLQVMILIFSVENRVS